MKWLDAWIAYMRQALDARPARRDKDLVKVEEQALEKAVRNTFAKLLDVQEAVLVRIEQPGG